MDNVKIPKPIVVYICLIHKPTGARFYYRQQYLKEIGFWGYRRPITKKTFEKRKKDGFHVEYRPIENYPKDIIRALAEIDTMIDLSLDTRDKEWFNELYARRRKLLGFS